MIRWVGSLGLVLALTTGAFGAGLTATWTDNANNETSQEIERKPGSCATPTAFTLLATVGANVTTYRDATAVEGQEFCYRVTAVNTAGRSAPSNTASGIAAWTIPVSPGALAITQGP
jgi:hypothetical protein